MKRSWAFNGLMGTAALLLPLTAVTESQVRAGAPGASLSAAAQINFKIIIPKILYLQIGREGVILSTGAGKALAQGALCIREDNSVLSGSRLLCTASRP